MGITVSAKDRWITAENFDYDWYLEQHPDLAALGTDQETLFSWYVTLGYDANRPARTISEYVNAMIKTYDLADHITNITMSDREKVKAIHDWLYIDVTRDDPIPDRPGVVYRYTYFLISESKMNQNHYPTN